MAAELILASEAEQDIVEAYLWYEGRRAGLSEEFLRFGRCVHGKHPPPTGDVPSCVRRLPALPDSTLSVCCLLTNTLKITVMIYAVFHTARDAGKWRQRLP
jgi:hypothetical protein